MTHRWESKFSITKIRSTSPCSKFQQNSRHLNFSVYLSFVWDFEDAQIFCLEMKLYIIIHIIYLCEKPDSVDFPRKKHQIFYTKTYFKSQISAYLRYFSSYKQMVFSAMGARFRRIFMRIIAKIEKAYSGSKGNESRLKLDIFNPKMLHKCPHELGNNSNPIDGPSIPIGKSCDGHRWAIDAHRWD